MRRMVLGFGFVITVILAACTTENDSGSSADAISPGTYSGKYTIAWYEDDPTLYPLLDIEVLNANGSATGKLYWLNKSDTLLLCESEFSWSQSKAYFIAQGGRQRCKEPDFIEDGFDSWFSSDGSDSSSIRNVTSQSFEMQGFEFSGKPYWVKMSK